MTEKECLSTRCLLARLIDIPPDDIRIIDFNEGDNLFLVPYDNEWEFGVSFEQLPTETEILLIIESFKEIGNEWLEEDEE